MSKARVRVPKSVKKGEVFEVKTLISHKMETGQRKDDEGNTIPRMIIHDFKATFNGEVVFSADWHPAISANPYMAFYMKAQESGELVLSWTDDNGDTVTKTVEVNVTS
ncbi:MAG: thiosulfate oxidation carrier complex protein SoxZ [Halofilum sp. (in: g-proteobacteria)]|nr:thiosulfate oxidation carrier complex protein SoxZ [Halofilum sp. (in: g-proteobacteria)]